MKIILANAPTPTEYTLHKQSVILGSAADADIRLSGEKVAPYHATIWQNRGVFAVSGWNARQKVEVNNTPITQSQRLWAGDTIKLGEIELVFSPDQASSAEPGRHATAGPVDAASAPVEAATSTPVNFGRILAGLLNPRRQQRPSASAASAADQVLTAMQTANRNDNAHYTIETDNSCNRADAPPPAVDQAAAWAFQCITMLFDYDVLLENIWTEQVILHLIRENIADYIAAKMVYEQTDPAKPLNKAELAQAKRDIRRQKYRHLMLETDVFKHKLGLDDVEQQWLKRLPLSRPADYLHEPYPRFRKTAFLTFLTDVTKRLPREVGALVWEKYYQLQAADLSAFLAATDILQTLSPQRYQDKRRPIPLWRAKLAFVVGGCYYLLNVVSRDSRGRLLAFKPGKPDDPGEQLTLMPVKDKLVDQQGRTVKITSKGLVTITAGQGKQQIKLLRPTPASRIKAQIAAILHQTSVLGPVSSSPDLDLALCPRAEHPFLIKQLAPATRSELGKLADVPIIINWDLQPDTGLLAEVRSSHRGVGHHALTVFRTRRNFVFDMSAAFFNPAWAMQLSQIISRETTSTCSLMARFSPTAALAPRPIPLQIQGGAAFRRAIQPHKPAVEAAAEAIITDVAAINAALGYLARQRIFATLPDMLLIYRGLHHHLYEPGETLQYALRSMMQNQQRRQAKAIAAFIKSRSTATLDLLYTPENGFDIPAAVLMQISIKLSALAQSLAALNAGADDKAQNKSTLIRDMRALTNALRPAREMAASPSAAMPFEGEIKAALSRNRDKFQLKTLNLRAAPKSSNKYELFLCHIAPPKASLLRFMNATDDGYIRPLTWSIVQNSRGHLQLTLRDSRPPIRQLYRHNQRALAKLVAQDYLDAYAAGVIRFSKNLVALLKL